MYLINVEFSPKDIRQNIVSVSWIFLTAYDKDLLEGDQIWKKLLRLQG